MLFIFVEIIVFEDDELVQKRNNNIPLIIKIYERICFRIEFYHKVCNILDFISN